MNIQSNLISQYQAGLAMLHQVVELCPDELWQEPSGGNAFWRVSYHALFYTHLYLHPSEQDFVPWAQHRPENRRMGPGGDPYSPAEILAYADLIGKDLDRLVAAAGLDAPSGFEWLQFNRLEAHLYNLRHLQQHVGELSERLGASRGIEVGWVMKGENP